jgi:hypothetical protein
MSAIILPRRTLLASGLAAFGLAGGAGAFAEPDPATLQIVDRETGEPLRLWRHAGRQFVAGQPGARYALRVTNAAAGRVLVVLSVDGVNVVTGETANYDQNGYVFDAYETYDVTGWRKSTREVAAFAFAPLSQSYAARTGRPNEVGVIGMAVFRERVIVREPPPAIDEEPPSELDRGGYRSEDAPAAAQRAAPAPPPPAGAARAASGALAQREAEPQLRDERLGTAHGAREWSVVDTTTFERATRYPACVRQIEYDTYAHLAAEGVIPRPWRAPPHPRPFPAAPGGPGFVPDPPG